MNNKLEFALGEQVYIDYSAKQVNSLNSRLQTVVEYDRNNLEYFGLMTDLKNQG